MSKEVAKDLAISHHSDALVVAVSMHSLKDGLTNVNKTQRSSHVSLAYINGTEPLRPEAKEGHVLPTLPPLLPNPRLARDETKQARNPHPQKKPNLQSTTTITP